LIAFHKSQKVKATLTAVQPPGRFGSLVMDGAHVTSFQEKPKGDGGGSTAAFRLLARGARLPEGRCDRMGRSRFERLARDAGSPPISTRLLAADGYAA
jgi:glucose-1-phosphate cytidylyltransferase